MRDETIDIDERINEEREKRLSSGLRRQDMVNRERLGECLKHLRVYLRGLSESAWAAAREAKRREEYEEMYREEERMRIEQYPCDEEDWMMLYEDDFRFEWM